MKKSENNNNNNKKKNMCEKFTFISKSKGAKNLLSISKELAWLFFHLSFDKKNTFYTYTLMHVKKLGISSINIPFVVFYSHINLRNKHGKFIN